MNKIITFDGESATGKSTAARMTANSLGIYYLASGLIYRFASWAENKFELRLEQVKELIDSGAVNYIWDGTNASILLNGKNITEELETEIVGGLTSRNASIPEKILMLNQITYSILESNNINEFTVDGRNVGSALFPQAGHKFYITADIKVRAARRHADLSRSDNSVTIDQVEQDLLIRDERDRNRLLFPLVVPSNAVVIDSSNITNEQMLAEVLKIVTTEHTEISFK